MKNTWVIAGLAITALLVVGVLYWWLVIRVEPVETTGEALEVLSETPLEAIAPASNPLQNKVPEINPVDKTNPFKNVYKNPFSQ